MNKQQIVAITTTKRDEDSTKECGNLKARR